MWYSSEEILPVGTIIYLQDGGLWYPIAEWKGEKPPKHRKRKNGKSQTRFPVVTNFNSVILLPELPSLQLPLRRLQDLQGPEFRKE